MDDTHSWRIEKMNDGLFKGKEHQEEGLYALEEIRKDVQEHINSLEDADQAYRDELTEIDYVGSPGTELEFAL